MSCCSFYRVPNTIYKLCTQLRHVRHTWPLALYLLCWRKIGTGVVLHLYVCVFAKIVSVCWFVCNVGSEKEKVYRLSLRLGTYSSVGGSGVKHHLQMPSASEKCQGGEGTQKACSMKPKTTESQLCCFFVTCLSAVPQLPKVLDVIAQLSERPKA